MPLLKLIQLLLQERFARAAVSRVPEPTLTMNDAGQIEAFHQQGAEALLPVYHFNALATSRITPRGGTVLDLGSGSARYLGYLAERRPDLRIIGLELAPDMAQLARQHLQALGVAERVEVRLGDMTTVASQVSERVDTISSVFSLHHLPSLASVSACMAQMRQLRERHGCAIWLFDFAQARHPATAALFPAVFTPRALAVFNEDTRNSLNAAFSYAELCERFAAAGLVGGESLLSRWMQLYQVHAFTGAAGAAAGAQSAWVPGKLSHENQSNWRKLQGLFPALPATP